jgi:hypothetical protein
MPALAPVIAMTWSSIFMVASSDGVDGAVRSGLGVWATSA